MVEECVRRRRRRRRNRRRRRRRILTVLWNVTEFPDPLMSSCVFSLSTTSWWRKLSMIRQSKKSSVLSETKIQKHVWKIVQKFNILQIPNWPSRNLNQNQVPGHSLSRQGIWALFGHPNPQKPPLRKHQFHASYSLKFQLKKKLKQVFHNHRSHYILTIPELWSSA